MVTSCVSKDSAIILCVGQAGTDPDTWVGKALAQQVDRGEERTIGVVTKVDTMFGIPDTGTKLFSNLGKFGHILGIFWRI